MKNINNIKDGIYLSKQFIMPIYWEETFKTKANKKHLVGMNFYRNAYRYTQNKLKQELHQWLSKNHNTKGYAINGTYTLSISIFYKSPICDGSNISALIEKIFLDYLQKEGIVKEDNVKYHLGTTWEVAEMDKENPRCEIQIKEIPNGRTK